MDGLPRYNANKIQLKRLMRQLEIDEGRKLKVYLDTEGLKTVGIGHLITDKDPPEIQNLQVGDSITRQQMDNLFHGDLAIAISDFRLIFNIWESLPGEVQEILINMIFNLGRKRFLGFKKLIAAIYNKDWKQASYEMQDSKWYRQVGKRAERLCQRMRDIDVLTRAGN